jgi:hypothetical protein
MGSQGLTDLFGHQYVSLALAVLPRESSIVADRFRIARNPDPDSRLPYLLWLPMDGGLVLKARDTWPRANRGLLH